MNWLEKCKSHRFWDEKDYYSLKEKGYTDKDVYVFWCEEDFGQEVSI